MKQLTKRQRTRVRRVLNNFRGPINHKERDGLDRIVDAELDELRKLEDTIRSKAVGLGYDPEEKLTDVAQESYYE